MPRTKSEIFDSYLQIALDRGLTKAAEENSETKKYKDDSEARAGSDSISTIEALYGVKPEGLKYEWNIMEVAHPNSVIVSPAYDKLNGLVENNIERQNIISNIARKPNTGVETNHKYAKKDLTLTLVRIANHMDNINNEELRKLADECLMSFAQNPFVPGEGNVVSVPKVVRPNAPESASLPATAPVLNVRDDLIDLANYLDKQGGQEKVIAYLKRVLTSKNVNYSELIGVLQNIANSEFGEQREYMEGLINKIKQLQQKKQYNAGPSYKFDPAVKEAQTVLRNQGYVGKDGKLINPDGYLGPNTMFALEAYKNKNNVGNYSTYVLIDFINRQANPSLPSLPDEKSSKPTIGGDVDIF